MALLEKIDSEFLSQDGEEEIFPGEEQTEELEELDEDEDKDDDDNELEDLGFDLEIGNE
ncbi:MAG: hypothetical protein Q8P03_00525 [bacterium]|nr:hypothetical protein [bacterium]